MPSATLNNNNNDKNCKNLHKYARRVLSVKGYIKQPFVNSKARNRLFFDCSTYHAKSVQLLTKLVSTLTIAVAKDQTIKTYNIVTRKYEQSAVLHISLK